MQTGWYPIILIRIQNLEEASVFGRYFFRVKDKHESFFLLKGLLSTKVLRTTSNFFCFFLTIMSLEKISKVFFKKIKRNSSFFLTTFWLVKVVEKIKNVFFLNEENINFWRPFNMCFYVAFLLSVAEEQWRS